MLEQTNRMGLQKMQSLFSDIFGCGGCNFAVPQKNKKNRDSDADNDRSYCNQRPIEAALQRRRQETFLKNQCDNFQKSKEHKGVNLCGGGHDRFQKDLHRLNQAAKEIMIACDEDDNGDENLFLNDTATTQPESFLLNDSSCLSLPSSIGFHDSPIHSLQDPPSRIFPQQHQVPMVPIEKHVEVWPPVLPSRPHANACHGGHPDHHRYNQYYHHQEQQHHHLHQDHLHQHQYQQQQSRIHGFESAPPPPFLSPNSHNSNNEMIPPIPVRPPQIRRLKLDDDHSRMEAFYRHPTRDANGIPEPLYRSRSLDFLFSNQTHSQRHHRYREEERTRHELLGMLSDLNETYTTL